MTEDRDTGVPDPREGRWFVDAAPAAEPVPPDDGVLDYDAENHALIFTERLGPEEMGAAAIVGHGVPPWIGSRLRLHTTCPLCGEPHMAATSHSSEELRAWEAEHPTVHVNTGAAEDRAMAWSEGYSEGFKDAAAEPVPLTLDALTRVIYEGEWGRQRGRPSNWDDLSLTDQQFWLATTAPMFAALARPEPSAPNFDALAANGPDDPEGRALAEKYIVSITEPSAQEDRG